MRLKKFTKFAYKSALPRPCRRRQATTCNGHSQAPAAGRPRGAYFSGGGIRSATFGLGVLQGLAARVSGSI
jgi:hypothetical protein